MQVGQTSSWDFFEEILWARVCGGRRNVLLGDRVGVTSRGWSEGDGLRGERTGVNK